MSHLDRKIKILHVFRRMDRGGAEMRTLDVMRDVDRRRYQMEFVATSGLPGTLDDPIRDLGGKVHYCALGATFPGRFRRLLRKEKFHVVHSHAHYCSGYYLRLAAKAGIPGRIAHFRTTADFRGNGLRRRLQRRLMRHWIDRNATHILAVGEGVMSAAWRPAWRADPRCTVVYNGLDGSPFSGSVDRREVRREFALSEECPLYVHVGSMHRVKNHLRLLSVFAEILNRDSSSHLLVVGKGDNAIQASVRARIEALGISGAVILTGPRSDVPRLLKAADMLIFPSLWEGLPGVVLEACAAGTPVLASDLPGVREIAVHLPLVRCLALKADDRQWAQQARELIIDEPQRVTSRVVARRLFAASPFNVRHCSEKLCRVWEDASRTHP